MKSYKRNIITKVKNNTVPKWSRKSILRTIIIFLFLFILIISRYTSWNNIKHHIFKNKYQTIQANIINIKEFEMPYSTKLGSEMKTLYKIEYSYEIAKKTYFRNKIIDQYPQIYNNKISVSYEITNPNNTSIILNGNYI